MAGKLDSEARMTIKELARRGWPKREIARTLDVDEKSVRYHLKRMQEGAVDGRGRQRQLADGWKAQIQSWLEAQPGVPAAGLNLAALHEFLRTEYGYEGSLRSLQRYFMRHYPRPARRARRRVETPPGAQAQIDWAEFRNVFIAQRPLTLYAFHFQLSYSRFGAIVWSERKDQLGWLCCHNRALERIGGVPAVCRVDNEKTAISRGAGAWGEINPAYLRYAQQMRFHVDACAPRSPEAKGKIERRILDQRLSDDPRTGQWRSLAELQRWSDERVQQSARRRTCPSTGTSVWEAWQREKPYLGPLPLLPEPFDVVVTRKVGWDCMVAFEGHSYSVPFAHAGLRVEVRGVSGRVQLLRDGLVVAVHPRHTDELILIEPSHFEGESTERVLRPLPLGRMGRKLQELGEMEPERRPIDLYAALAEAAR